MKDAQGAALAEAWSAVTQEGWMNDAAASYRVLTTGSDSLLSIWSMFVTGSAVVTIKPAL